MLTPEDLNNLLVIMNRAQYAGLNEAMGAVQIATKIKAMLAPKPAATPLNRTAEVPSGAK